MNIIEKSESIRAGLRKGFQDGTSKMAQRRCYGYDTGSDGKLVVNPNEAAVVRWIFDRYLSGDSLNKIAAGPEEQGIPSPSGKPKWNREAINKLISNEKYTGQVLRQKTISAGGGKIKNDGFVDRYLYSDSHDAIISNDIFYHCSAEKTQSLQRAQKRVFHRFYILRDVSCYVYIFSCLSQNTQKSPLQIGKNIEHPETT